MTAEAISASSALVRLQAETAVYLHKLVAPLSKKACLVLKQLQNNFEQLAVGARELRGQEAMAASF